MSIWVLFDLDGTLVDNSEGITKSTQFALDSYGYPNQPMETLKKFIGPPLHESFMEFYGFSKEQAFEAVDRYRVRYKEKGVYENRLYPGMKELLEALKSAGVKLSVSTSKPTVFTENILKQNGIFELFDQIVGANLDGSMTDKTEVMQDIEKICELLECSFEYLIFYEDNQRVVQILQQLKLNVKIAMPVTNLSQLFNLDIERQ